MVAFKKTTREIGKFTEERACHYLEQQGLKLLTRNFLCKMGEIDLIMQDEDDLVFIEVRYRHSDDYGDGVESITWHKQKKIINAANIYLNKYKFSENLGCRFDVIAVSAKQRIDWIKNAFQLH